MARRTVNYTVEDEGRDKDKVFVLTEMSSTQAEEWALRAILALMDGGVDLPPGFEAMGMAGLAEVGIKALAGLKWEVAKPLLDEMWVCAQFVPDPSSPQVVRKIFDGDIEEVLTRIKIRAEIWKLHTDFSKAVAPSTSDGSQATAKAKIMPNIKTSRR